MEEKWPSKDTGGAGDSDGGGDNSQNAQNKRKCDSASGSATTIHQSLENLVSNSAVSLDLSRRDLQHLTGNIYKFLNLKHLHLEGNALSLIPGDFFQRLPNLVWLDLRYNKIKELPSEIGCHRQLKTLLLERNPIKRLPVQLGNVTSLTALNLRHCPLEFPPLEVIQKGLSAILSFLRKYRNQNLDCSEPVSPEMPTVEKLNLTDLMKSSLDLSDGWPNEEEMIRFQKLRDEFIQDEREEYLSNKMTTNESMSSLPTTKTKGSFSCKSSKVSSRGKRSIFPAVSSYDFLVQSKRVEDFRLAALKEMKEKQDLIEQRRKDKEVLQKWRRQAKLMRERKGTLYTLSPDKGDAVSQYAPYATDDINDHSTLGDWKDLNKQDERMETALNMDPMTFTDELRAAKYKEVANRIKQHTEMMKERRKKLSGIPQEDMERAKQDFETAEKLEEEVEILKKGLHKEYRFTAFTGELPPSMKHSLPTPKPQNIFSNMTF
ncbi:leucine-rich repeat-containing protein 27 isoform X2 [Hemicordylus capensis]|uniref:leucine-rich repeat-containing protein 27 isoform X2 n=1 Tax=Hemicordylus capensis TaxID=884348 RepID=UPI002303874E|nr:leucine-rich repeat-containing protein 27 isoform X2 [Hemicordylus capensis]